ncbi:MAG: hypothetical protein MJZ72_05400 [Bacteroidales bacterium]|nr:hypothetical protein [Bacteroidales bacterium]
MQKSNSCFFNLILVAFFSFFTACLSGQTAIFVSPSGNDSNSGTSWGDAKKTLAGALEAASGTANIYMMVGNYTCANVLIPDGVTVKGGYASYDTVIVMGMVLLVDVSGTDTTHRRYPGSNANWTQATLCTILDGNNASRVATVNAGGKLEGCVITHGSVSGNGGGVLINGGTVQHCVIIHNSALDNIELNGKGGGAYVQNNGFLLNCVVAYNSANNGPGVAGIHGTLINNTITENSAIVLPVVTTNDVANITTTTASCGGNVTSDGGSSVTARGVCWSISHNPTISNSHTSNGTGTGNFTSNLIGLSPNTTYYVRAYATNGAGTAYGEERAFTTNCNSVTVNITGSTTIPYGNSTTLTASGASSYVWAADSSTIGTSASVTVHPTSTTAYTVTGTNTYGCTGTSSVTVTVYTQPTVITNNVANITTTTASCGGNVTSDGGSSVTARGVCWSISHNPTISNSHTSNGTGTGNFTSNLIGLSPNTTYYVRAYATNGAGTAYGEERAFTTNCNSVTVNITGSTTIPYGNSTTLTASGASSYVWAADSSTIGTSASVTVHPTSTTAYTVTGTNTYGCTGTSSVTVTVYTQPTVITNNVANITTSTASCGGNVTSDGGSSVTARGVCWSTSHNPTISNSHTSNGTGIGNFASNLTGLIPNTTYYVRAYATNSVGTAYGEERTFTTTCNSVTIYITGSTTISYGNSTTLTASGASNYIWDDGSTTIGTSASVTVDPTSTTAYTVTGTNTYGCTGTNSVTVTITYTRPTVITNNVTDITTTTASCGGNVTSDGGSSVTARGVCWSTSHNPTISNSYTSNGTGTGSFTSNLTGLNPNTTYYVRAYATNSIGTAYGNEVSFSALQDGQPCPGASIVVDYDGNTYNTALIGNQCWMKQNLRTTHYSNGVSIELGSNTSDTTPYRYYPNNSSSNVSAYGYLYNWYAVMYGANSSETNPSGVQGICPTNWHVPSDAEWTQLTDYVSSVPAYTCGGNTNYIAKALASTTGWRSQSSTCFVGNMTNNNATGFGAMPAGDYQANFSYYAYFWSATENTSTALIRYLRNTAPTVLTNYGNKMRGYSVRCLRD